jgi:predicted transcriptional regulator
VPNQPATPGRSVRIPDELWERILREADDRAETATEVILRALEQYFRRSS